MYYYLLTAGGNTHEFIRGSVNKRELIYNEDIINIYNSIGGKAKVKPVFCVDGNVYKLSNTDMPINNLVIFLIGYIEGSAK